MGLYKRNIHCVAALIAVAMIFLIQPSYSWTSDNRNGTFTNPVLYGDYPDPDIIRVGSDFYMVTTTFVSIPGIEILHSKDLINWEIAGYAITSIDTDPKYNLTGGNEYAQGVWAPCIRYRNGTFYIIDNIQGAGTVICRATNPAGPWTVNKLNAYLYDPGFMFDDDGTPLVYHGTGGDIWVATLNSGLTSVVSDVQAYKLSSGEGSHAYKINGYYYVFNSVYGQYPVLLCSRSTNKTGPYTTVTVCDNHTPWASPHQGGIVQLANGDWWGFSLLDAGSIGRDLWIGPVTWSNNWPYFGNPSAPSIPTTNSKPNVGATYPVSHVPASDEFSSTTLGAQWQWNHNPDTAKYSLTARPGYLRLNTQTAPNYSNARNTLTLRTEGPKCTAVVKIDTKNMAVGDRAGFSLLEQYFGYIAVYKNSGSQRIIRAVNNNGDLSAPSEDVTDTVSGVTSTTLWLKIHCDFNNSTAQFSYSENGTAFTQVGGDFPMHFTLATFQGERYGIFNYNPAGSSGYLDVDYFRQDDDINRTSKLHITGRFLQDPNGKNVGIHGYMQPGEAWFNGGGANFGDPSDFANPYLCAPALNFYDSVSDIMTTIGPIYGQSHGWYANYVRYIGDGGGVSNFAAGWDVNGNLAKPDQFNGWIQNIVVPYVTHCKANGLYVVICGNPSVAYPGGDSGKNMTQQYQQNLITFWSTLASTSGIKNADNVMFEMCNEPISIESSFGKNDWGIGGDAYDKAITSFMQPIVNAIRSQGADNIIWIPGLGWQGTYAGFAKYPLQGGNIGYAAHIYPAYGGMGDNTTQINNVWNSNYKPCADFAPMIVTEFFWDPNDGQGYQSLWNASTAGFGNAMKNCIDTEGNVSYLVGMVGDQFANLNNGLANATLGTSQGVQAAFSWWPSYTSQSPESPIVNVPEGIYTISPADNIKLAVGVKDADSNGTLIEQNTYIGRPYQMFYFHALGNNIYWLEPQNAAGKCLEVINNNYNNAAGLDIADYQAGLGQKWYVIKLTNGSYRLCPVLNPTQSINQPGGNTNAGVALQTYAFSGAVAQQWQINQANTVSPAITSIAPASTPALAAFTLTVNGSSFVSGSIVKWNGIALATTYVSATKLTAAVTTAQNASLASYPGSAAITVINPSGNLSNTMSLTIAAPVPVISSLLPLSARATVSVPLTVTGTNFIAGAQIQWNGTSLQTTAVSSTKLTATVPAALNAKLSSYPGSIAVTVANPGPQTSLPVNVTIAAPILHTYKMGIQMISSPCDYSGTPLASILETTSLNFYGWDASKLAYIPNPTVPTDTLHAGRGYWALFPADTNLLDVGTHISASSPYSVSLSLGWNMIGSPRETSVTISSLKIKDQSNNTYTVADAVSKRIIYTVLFTYPSGSKNYTSITTSTGNIAPYAGYWIYAYKQCSIVF